MLPARPSTALAKVDPAGSSDFHLQRGAIGSAGQGRALQSTENSMPTRILEAAEIGEVEASQTLVLPSDPGLFTLRAWCLMTLAQAHTASLVPPQVGAAWPVGLTGQAAALNVAAQSPEESFG